MRGCYACLCERALLHFSQSEVPPTPSPVVRLLKLGAGCASSPHWDTHLIFALSTQSSFPVLVLLLPSAVTHIGIVSLPFPLPPRPQTSHSHLGTGTKCGPPHSPRQCSVDCWCGWMWLWRPWQTCPSTSCAVKCVRDLLVVAPGGCS